MANIVDSGYWGSKTVKPPKEKEEEEAKKWGKFYQVGGGMPTAPSQDTHVTGPTVTSRRDEAVSAPPVEPYAFYRKDQGQRIPTFEDLLGRFEGYNQLAQDRGAPDLPGSIVEQWQQDRVGFGEQTQNILNAQRPPTNEYPFTGEGLSALLSGRPAAGAASPGVQNYPMTGQGSSDLMQDPGALRGDYMRGWQPPGEGSAHPWGGFHTDAPSSHGLLVDYLNQKSFEKVVEDYFDDLENQYAFTPPALPFGGGGGGGGGYSYPANDPYWWMKLVKWNI